MRCSGVVLLAMQAHINIKPGASDAVCRYNDRDTAGREDRRGSGAFKPAAEFSLRGR
jgi:hypothetical protein